MTNIYKTPVRVLKAIALSTIFFTANLEASEAQSSKDSVVTTIHNLSGLFKKGILSERKYLDSVQETVKILQARNLQFSSKEMQGLLATYRKIVWDNEDYEKIKQEYYAMLSNQAFLNGRNGEMLYYTEKLSQLEQESSASVSVSSLTFMACYYCTKFAHPKTLALYTKNRSFIARIPQMAQERKLERQELMRSFNMFSYFSEAAFKRKDSISASEIAHIMDQLTDIVIKAYPGDKEMHARLQYIKLTIQYQKHTVANQQAEVLKDIGQLDALARDPNTPGYLKNYVGFNVADCKAVYFLENMVNDSARHYIDVLNKMYAEKLIPVNAYMVKKYKARVLYNEGRFKESEDTLINALVILEKNNSGTTSEIDDVMYALTKVEDQQFLLADSAKKQKRSDRQLLMLGSGALLLLSGSVLVFGTVRRRQKMRFLDFKLNLARNIHDETNPALLYAKVLAKEERIGQPDKEKGALETHIEHTMELIRSLSHDLKSEQQFRLLDLSLEIRRLLEKLSKVSDFTYAIRETVEKKRFLSHYQYHNLKAVLQECIANSIKHAEFKHVDVGFIVDANRLTISYKDDGQGWPHDQKGKGIGLQNIQERADKLNGTVEIHNNYPSGFRIDMTIKLMGNSTKLAS